MALSSSVPQLADGRGRACSPRDRVASHDKVRADRFVVYSTLNVTPSRSMDGEMPSGRVPSIYSRTALYGAPGGHDYEDVKRAADANGTTVEQTLATIAKTADKDRGDHPAEYQNA